jgi:uncharacterized protein (DUF2252 family)
MKRPAAPWARLVLLGCGLACEGCPPEQVRSHPSPPVPASAVAPDALRIPFDPQAFRTEPQLLERIVKSPFGYFRYVNAAFARAVCARYAGALDDMPVVNLHGDAHLEQYAVAADGRGLADFDMAATGPPVVDLGRFATSIALAAGEDRAGATRAIEAFLRGYEQGVDDATVTGPEPAVAARIRSTFAATPVAWLDRVEKLMLPVDESERDQMNRAHEQYVGAMLTQNPDLTPSFFRFKRIGALNMGLGSAHEAKFLARVEGPTDAPDDDVILEAKQMANLPAGSCVQGQDHDPLRVIVGQSRLAMSPQRYLGYVQMKGKTFYVHAWRVHYTELSVSDLRDSGELAEVAYDVGLQLGRGHPKDIAEPHGRDLRDALKRTVQKVGPSLPEAAFELARRVRGGWEEFRRAAEKSGE